MIGDPYPRRDDDDEDWRCELVLERSELEDDAVRFPLFSRGRTMAACVRFAKAPPIPSIRGIVKRLVDSNAKENSEKVFVNERFHYMYASLCI